MIVCELEAQVGRPPLAEFRRSIAPKFTSINESRSRTSAGRDGSVTAISRSRLTQCDRVPDIKFTNRAVELTPSLLRALRNW
ncbi:hypothetical protein SAMN05443579_107146 [Variovorax sp. PDC80]|nr:hypothetical protein SAMN05443579_107146 [Variovorax sp. PDC80]